MKFDLRQVSEINIQFNQDLYQVLRKDFIIQQFDFLTKTFQEDYSRHFPTTIIYEGQLLYLIHLSKALQNLKECKGFDEHIREYKNDVESTYFVTLLADYLKSKNIELILEPELKGLEKKADILISINNQRVLIECKNPKKDVLSLVTEEHEQMYSILSQYISRPCDVSISYETSFTDERLHALGNFLKTKLLDVTGEGIILNTAEVKVEVTNVRDEFQNIEDVKLCRLWENYHSNELNPGTIINRNGIGLFFVKRGVSFESNIKNQFSRAKRKGPIDLPFVLAIHAENISGSLERNIEFISSQFNPNKYRSFSGVLLVRYSYNIKTLIEISFKYVNNPYSRNPIPRFSNVFITEDVPSWLPK